MAVRNRLIALMGEMQAETGEPITIALVADKTKLSRKAINEWRSNKVQRFDAKTITALCKFFNCSVGDLLVYEPDAPQAEGEK